MSSIVERGVAVVARIIPDKVLTSRVLYELYSQGEIHKYRKGDVLVLRGDYLGFGVRPVAVVKGYEISKDTGKGMYLVEMHSDREVDTTEGRTSREQEHSKWNMEFLFGKVPKGMTPNEALSFYQGERSNWGMVQPQAA